MSSEVNKNPEAAGFVKPGFEHVQDVFRHNIQSGVERGGSFAAYFKGELVVNLWGGFTDEEARKPWQHNTICKFYSCTKSACALVMAHLVERGLVQYEQPVSCYWPEFAQNGKEKITLKHMLSLKAGLPILSVPYKLAWMREDPQRLELLLAQQKPWHIGDSAAYSPIVIGLYLDQIVKKVDPQQRSLAEYFHTEIAQPFGIDFRIGMPKSEWWRLARQVRTVGREEIRRYKSQLAADPNIDHLLLTTSATQPTDFLKSPSYCELPCGASHGMGTAEGMAKLQGIVANGGSSVDGRRLLSKDTIQMLQTPLSMGPEKMFGIELFYSYGMELLPVVEGDELHYNIGHGGFGGQFAAADVKHRTGWAYCTNYIDPRITLTGNTKWISLEAALFKCVHALEGIAVGRRHIQKASELQEILQSLKSKL